MRVIIAGGSGKIGQVLAQALHHKGHEVVVLSRSPFPAPWRMIGWDGATLGRWAEEFEGADAVINLAGQSVNCRYTPHNRKIITDSRVKSTKVIGEAILRAWSPPSVWLQASTATIYAHRYDAANDEMTGIMGGAEPNVPEAWRFSIDVATAWENALKASPTPNTRRVAMRTAIVMHPGAGSPFDMLLRLVRFGFGGQAGDGKQYVSWIHEHDFVRAVEWLIGHEELEGPVNIASPNPLPNAEFMRLLREAWGIPYGCPQTELMLEVGACLLGSETELILKSRRVIPARLLGSGFEFAFPRWADAAKEICQRVETMSRAAA